MDVTSDEGKAALTPLKDASIMNLITFEGSVQSNYMSVLHLALMASTHAAYLVLYAEVLRNASIATRQR